MLFRLILVNVLFQMYFTMNLNQECDKARFCSNETEICYPVVMNCHYQTCFYHYFIPNKDQRSLMTFWFYDLRQQDCRKDDHLAVDKIYFRILDDCRKFCSNPETYNATYSNDTLSDIFEEQIGQDETAVVHLNIGSPQPEHLKELLNMTDDNEANAIYKVQTDYFQNYRRYFANFLNAPYQLMLKYWQSKGALKNL